LPPRHAVELRVQLAGLKFGLRFDLLPAFPPAGVGAGEDILRRGFALPQRLFLRLAGAV